MYTPQQISVIHAYEKKNMREEKQYLLWEDATWSQRPSFISLTSSPAHWHNLIDRERSLQIETVSSSLEEKGSIENAVLSSTENAGE